MCSSRYVLSKVQVRSMATTTYSAQCCLARIAEGKLKQVTAVCFKASQRTSSVLTQITCPATDPFLRLASQPTSVGTASLLD